jgi:O-acetyl-ADP-ribose deacetylase (regulator of RNase III)
MSARRTYAVGASRLVLDSGSVLDAGAEVVVSSDDYTLSMSGGVSAAILAAAGSALALDAAKAVPRETGDVVVTTAGALSARYVFHVVTIGPELRRGALDEAEVIPLVRAATRKCLDLAEVLGVRSIAFPALGTGAAGFSIEASAAAMADVVSEVLTTSQHVLDVSIMLMGRRLTSPMQYLAFYEEFARRVPHVTAANPMTAPTQSTKAAPVSDFLELERQRQRLEQQLVDLRRDQAGSPADLIDLRQTIERNTDERLRAAERELDTRTKPVSIFVSYAHEDRAFRKKLHDHLGGLRGSALIDDWHDGEITAGSDWADDITAHMDAAELILLLITPSFMGSDFIARIELAKALERHRAKTAVVIPIIMREVYWQDTAIGGLQALPQDGKAVTMWDKEDTAFVDIARGIGRTVKDVIASRAMDLP